MKNLATALLKAQKSMTGAVKDSKNPFFKSNYADLGSVIDASVSILNDNGIVVAQPTVVIDGKQYVKTELIHADSGESLSGLTLIVTKNDNDAQQFGAGITYARRFGLQSLVVLKSLDDDGNTASGKVVTESKSYSAPSTFTKPIAAKPTVIEKTQASIQDNAVTSSATAKPVTKASPFSLNRTASKTNGQ